MAKSKKTKKSSSKSKGFSTQETLEDFIHIDDDSPKTMLTITFDYEVKCNTQDDHEVLISNHMKFGKMVNYSSLECVDEVLPFSMAYEAVLETFYTFEIEKKGFYGISDITIRIKNLEFE